MRPDLQFNINTDIEAKLLKFLYIQDKNTIISVLQKKMGLGESEGECWPNARNHDLPFYLAFSLALFPSSYFSVFHVKEWKQLLNLIIWRPWWLYPMLQLLKFLSNTPRISPNPFQSFKENVWHRFCCCLFVCLFVFLIPTRQIDI